MRTEKNIDIVEQKRITEILECENNYVLDAQCCEAMDGWVPDIGLSYYPYQYKSIYRPSCVSSSGIKSTIRHRFIQPRGKKAEPGKLYHIGVLLYDDESEQSRLEFQLGSEDIGCIEASRQDNRRHLLVMQNKVFIEGGMQTLQVFASGKGVYRIEAFVLIEDLPASSKFIPTIRHLSVIDKGEGENRCLEFHFITEEASRCELVLEANSSITMNKSLMDNTEINGVMKSGSLRITQSIEELNTLHTIPIYGLSCEKEYTVSINATEKSGAVCRELLSIKRKKNHTESLEKIEVPIELANTCGRALIKGGPITFGLPFPEGKLYEAVSQELEFLGHRIACQTRVHSKWSDGSARWILFDASLPFDMKPKEVIKGEAVLGGQGEVSCDKSDTIISHANSIIDMKGLVWNVNQDDISIQGRFIKVVVDKKNSSLPIVTLQKIIGDGVSETAKKPMVINALREEFIEIVLGNGVRLNAMDPEGVILEECGSYRAVVYFKIPHADTKGNIHFYSSIRLHVFYEQPYIKLVHRLEVVSPALTPVEGGREIRDHKNTYTDLEGSLGGLDGEATSMICLKSAKIKFDMPSIRSISVNDQIFDNNNGCQVKQEHDLAYSIGTVDLEQEIQGRFAGFLTAETEVGTIVMGVKDFWQLYPKGIAINRDKGCIELLPELSDKAFPGDADAWHRLYFWNKNGEYVLKAGMAITNEILIGSCESFDQAGELYKRFEMPVYARPSVSWLNSCNFMRKIGSKSSSILFEYEEMIDKALQLWYEDREKYRQYGFLNFGDWYGETLWSWGNNEYDPPYAHSMEFLRGGDAGWIKLAVEATRHLVDVDTVNWSANPKQIGGQYMHLPGHTGGYLPPLFKSKLAGTHITQSHMWGEGAAVVYFLTGDQFIKETLDKTTAWLSFGSFNNYEFFNCRECGWRIINLCSTEGLIDNPRSLNAALIIVEKVLERQHQDGGWVHILPEAHCGCKPPRCFGEAGFMVGVLLSALYRMFEITGDQRISKAIVKGAEWLVNKTYDIESKQFKYTSCVNNSKSGLNYTKMVLDAIACAYGLSGQSRFKDILDACLPSIGSLDFSGDSGFGKALCSESRYIPSLLGIYSLQERRFKNDV